MEAETRATYDTTTDVRRAAIFEKPYRTGVGSIY